MAVSLMHINYMHTMNYLGSKLCLPIRDRAHNFLKGIDVHMNNLYLYDKIFNKNFSSFICAHRRMETFHCLQIEQNHPEKNSRISQTRTSANTCLSVQLASHGNPNQARSELGNSEEAETKMVNSLHTKILKCMCGDRHLRHVHTKIHMPTSTNSIH